MASYTVNAGERGAHAKTLVASTADTVTFSENVAIIEVTNLDGADRIYVRLDGTAAAVANAFTYVLPATICTRKISVPMSKHSSPAISLISAGTPTYSVTKVDALDPA